jgi:hypothetical protein
MRFCGCLRPLGLRLAYGSGVAAFVQPALVSQAACQPFVVDDVQHPKQLLSMCERSRQTIMRRMHTGVPQEARKLGDFLLVGLHTDEDVSGRRGPHLPIMNLHERSLSVLACKHVDEARQLPGLAWQRAGCGTILCAATCVVLVWRSIVAGLDWLQVAPLQQPNPFNAQPSCFCGQELQSHCCRCVP